MTGFKCDARVKRIFQLGFLLLLFSIAYLSLLPGGTGPDINVWDKAQHFFAYLVLMLLCDLAIQTGDRSLFKFGFVFMYSVAIECFQALIPGRQFSILDMLANGLGAITAMAILVNLRRFSIYQCLKN